jgi:hypothetical protein
MKTQRALIPTYSLVIGILLVVSTFAGGERGAVQAAASLQSGGLHKLILEKGSVDADRPGISLWHDYGAFALYRVTDQALSSLSVEGFGEEIAAGAEMDRILIDAYPFNPLTDNLDLPPELSLEEPSGPALQLIQFVGPLKAEWLAQIESSGAAPVHYIANNAYLVWADENARGKLDTLVKEGNFLQYSAPYQPYFKLGPTLRERVTSSSDPEEVLPVVIQLVRHAGQAESETLIEKLSVAQIAPWYPVLAYQNTIVAVRAADIAAVAQLPDVTWVGERFERELMDESQGQILAGTLDAGQTGPSGPGYLAWLGSFGFSQDPLDYPIVDVTDDGIGNGLVNSGDNTLHVSGSTSNPTRLAYVQNCTSAADGGGIGGHGHINASIVGGYDNRAGAAYNDAAGFNLGLGINPYGRLAGTRVFGPTYDISGCGGSDPGVIQANYTAGARISSNSWGCSACAGTYDDSSQAYDVGVRDADLTQPGNQPLVYVFSAGNDGESGSSTVGSPGNAKNVITVGASENDRPTWTDGCAVGPTGADNAMDIIGFSSRGPAPGGRVKPEVVAPGTHIQGTASTNPDYDGSSVCDAYQPGGQTVFAASSGTSHSTPAVAGVASLYTYWLENTYSLAAPSPALIKAYLIAHPVYLTGVGANDTLPSNSQGYGMPDMSLAFEQTDRHLVDQSVVLDNSGETWTFTGGVPDPAKPVRIVLAYTDQAGAIGVSPQVNNLDLTIEVGGETYVGNHFTGAWSEMGGTADTNNNYEAIFLPAGVSGGIDITITASNIAGDGVPNSGDSTDQDFALVCYNCNDLPDFSLAVTPESLNICTQENTQAVYDLSIGSILGYNTPVTLSASGQPGGSTVNFGTNPVTPPGTSLLTISNISAGLEGSFTIEIEGDAAGNTKSASAGLDLFSSQPGIPVIQTPANGAEDIPLQPAFTWTAAARAATYDIEIATDSSFTNIVNTGTGLTEPSYTPDIELDSSTIFYWRVRASNSCGEGTYSSTASFTTVLLPGDCPVGQAPQEIYSTDFEAEDPGWSHTGTGDTWTLSGDRAHSGDQSFLATDVPTLSDQQLVSPAISLPEDQEPLFLEFWNYQEIERNSTDEFCFDAAILEISTDDGGSWTKVPSTGLLTDPYHLPVSDNFDNPLAGQEAWCGDPQDWLNSIVALDAYAGQSVRFRFRLATDTSVGREGWYVDDVVVQGCQVSEAETGGVSLSAGQTGSGRIGETVSYIFTVTNTGDFADTYDLDVESDWPADLSESETGLLEPGGSQAVQLAVSIPTGASDGGPSEAILTATSTTDSSVTAETLATTFAHWWRSYLTVTLIQQTISR